MILETQPVRSFDTAAARRVLIADDQPDIVAALRLLLRGAGLQTDAACSVQEYAIVCARTTTTCS